MSLPASFKPEDQQLLKKSYNLEGLTWPIVYTHTLWNWVVYRLLMGTSNGYYWVVEAIYESVNKNLSQLWNITDKFRLYCTFFLLFTLLFTHLFTFLIVNQHSCTNHSNKPQTSSLLQDPRSPSDFKSAMPALRTDPRKSSSTELALFSALLFSLDEMLVTA